MNVRRPLRRRGMALLAVMMVVLLVALAAYGMNQRMEDAYRVSQRDGERVQARLAAQGAVEFLLAEVSQPRSLRLPVADLVDPRFTIEIERFEGDSASSSSATNPLAGEALGGTQSGLWRAAVVSPVVDWTEAREPEQAWRLGWVDESNKLNLQALSRWEQQFPGHARECLLRLPGADAQMVDGLIDAYGMESRSKASSGRAEQIKENLSRRAGGGGVDLASLWSLRWNGGDWNQDYRLDDLEASMVAQVADDATAGESRSDRAPVPWRDLLTFHSGQRNENSDGRRRIFLNASDLRSLHQRLLEIWPVERANFVVAVRQFGLAVDNKSMPSVEGADWSPDFSLPTRYRISNPLDLINATVVVTPASGEARRLMSPLTSDKDSLRDYLGTLVDDVTTDPNDLLVGQINVNRAPPLVLAAIPGIDSATVDAIVAARERTSRSFETRSNPAWLVTRDVIDLPTLSKLLPWINTGGDCYSAQVIGYRDVLSPIARWTVILDGRTHPSQARQIQTWQSWGRGFDLTGLLGDRPPSIGVAR